MNEALNRHEERLALQENRQTYNHKAEPHLRESAENEHVRSVIYMYFLQACQYVVVPTTPSNLADIPSLGITEYTSSCGLTVSHNVM